MESSLLAQAILLAAKAHKDQVDKAGEPYILHPLRIMFRLRELGYSESAQAAAVLHDVVEDTEITIGEIEDLDPYVADLVDRLSRREWEELLGNGEWTTKKEEYAKFIRRAAENPMSRMIKYLDIRDNLARLDKLTPANQEFLTKRYAKALAILREFDPSL